MSTVLILRQAYYPGNLRFRYQAEALERAGLKVVVICLRQPGEKSREVLNSVKVIRLPFSWHRRSPLIYLLQYVTFFIMTFWMVSLLHLYYRFQYVLVSNLPDILVFSAVLPRLTGARVTLDIRDPLPESVASKYQLALDHKLCRIAIWEEQLSCRFAHGVITVHQPLANVLNRRGVSTEKLTVLLNLPSAKIFKQRFIYFPCNEHKGNRFEVIYNGTLASRFGVDLVLEAIAEIKDQTPELRFSIYGEGDALSSLRKQVANLHLNGIVSFKGFQPAEVISVVLAQADLAVIPHRRNLAMDLVLPTKLLECMSVGTPAIVSDTPVVRALVPQNAVHLFTAGDKHALAEGIIHLYRDRNLASIMARHAMIWVTSLNSSGMESKFVQAILGEINDADHTGDTVAAD